MINECAELIKQEYIDRARRLGVALLCDGAKAAKLDLVNCGCMEASIMPVDREMKMAGTAMLNSGFPYTVKALCRTVR